MDELHKLAMSLGIGKVSVKEPQGSLLKCCHRSLEHFHDGLRGCFQGPMLHVQERNK